MIISGHPEKGVINIVKKKKKAHVRESTYPHFRYYKPSKHPALIVAEHSEEEYKYRKVMHSEKDGNKKRYILIRIKKTNYLCT